MQDERWHGVSMQNALLQCQVLEQDRFTEAGPGKWYWLQLDHKLIDLGPDKHFADTLLFALHRNARAFENIGCGDPEAIKRNP